MNKPHFKTDKFRADSAAGIAPIRPAPADAGDAPRRSTLAGNEAAPAANSADAEALRRPSGDLIGSPAGEAARRLHCELPGGGRSWSC